MTHLTRDLVLDMLQKYTFSLRHQIHFYSIQFGNVRVADAQLCWVSTTVESLRE